MARKLELKGTATCYDQHLFLDVEGNLHTIRLFTDWCKTGPRGCMIDNIDIIELPLADYTTFEIIHVVVRSARHGILQ